MGRVLQALRRSRRMTAAEDRESRVIFTLVTGDVDEEEEREEEAVMTVAQLRRSLRALGFSLATGEARELVYEFDYDNSQTLRLADFQRIFLVKLLEHGERQRFNDAFCALSEGDASIRVCDLVASSKDLQVARDCSDSEDVEKLDAGVFARHLQAQYYGDDLDDAIASEADAIQAAGVDARVSRDTLAMFLRVDDH